MRITIIASLDEAGGIGKDNRLLQRIPADLKRFKALTMGHPIIMGRKTFESIGRPLPGRENIVITRNADIKAAGCTVVHSLDEAVKAAAATGTDEVFVIGGAEIYRQALPLTDRLELTLIEGTYQADTFFPEYEADFAVTAEETRADENPPYTFVTLERAS